MLTNTSSNLPSHVLFNNTFICLNKIIVFESTILAAFKEEDLNLNYISSVRATDNYWHGCLTEEKQVDPIFIATNQTMIKRK